MIGLNSKASFILHTDPNINYWGEMPFDKISDIDSYILANNNGVKIVKCTWNQQAKQNNVYNLISNVESGGGYCEHKYGAINLYPNQNIEKSLKKIIRLLLQYHDSLETICLSCQHQLGLGTEVRTDWLPDKEKYGENAYSEKQLIEQILFHRHPQHSKLNAILYCSCSKCGEFWVRSHCLGKHHPLLKFEDSFHKKSEPNYYKWSYDCPVCGSQL